MPARFFVQTTAHLPPITRGRMPTARGLRKSEPASVEAERTVFFPICRRRLNHFTRRPVPFHALEGDARAKSLYKPRSMAHRLPALNAAQPRSTSALSPSAMR